MASLQGLPLELICGIFDFLEDIPDLRNLCQVSKLLSAIAQPLLYREVDLTQSNTPFHARSLHRLNRTMIDHPHAREWIRSLNVAFTYSEEYQQLPESYGDHDDKIAKALRRLQVIFGVTEWPNEGFCTSITLSMLLLSGTPRLKKLKVHVDLSSLALLVRLCPQTPEKFSALGNIESLGLTCHEKHGIPQSKQIGFRDIEPLFLLPRLKSIWIAACSGGDRDAQSPPSSFGLLPGTVSVELISFTSSCISASDISMLIQSCKKLVVFAFNDRCTGRPQFAPMDILPALACQMKSLEDLRVSFDAEDMDQLFEWDDFQYGPFGTYKCLKFLAVDDRFLALSPNLSQSLAYLVLEDCRSNIYDQLSIIVKLVRDDNLPFLKTVSVHGSFLFPGGMLDLPLTGATDVLLKEAQKRLVDLFQGTAVNLIFDGDLLERTALGYDFARGYQRDHDYGPFIFIE